MKIRKQLMLFMAALTIICTSCERVAPNYVGVLMENYGKSGKSDFTITKGRVSTISPGTELFQVPLFEQRADFGDKALSLKASDNTAFTSRPTYSYSVIEQRAIDVVFQNKQLGSGDDFMRALEDNILETKIYDIMKEQSRSFLTDSLMAIGGSLKFERSVESLVKKAFEEKGLQLSNFSCQLEFSEKVREKIDNRNEVNTNVSVIDQKIIEQRKQNELEALRTEQNIIRAKGITPQILQEKAIEKWNGVLPSTITGGANTVMNIPIKN